MSIKKFKHIRRISFICYLIAAAFAVMCKRYDIIFIIPTAIFISLGIFIDFNFHRCPHCKKHINSRVKLKKEIKCPSCNKIIK